MPRQAPRYYTNDDYTGVTPSRLKRMSRARQLEYVVHWFHRHFEDPAQETPYISREGGYQYIWGGPYEARDQLHDEFGHFLPEDLLEQAVAEVEREGTLEWAPGQEHPSQIERREEWARQQNEEDAEEAKAGDIEIILEYLERGVEPKFGDRFEIERRRDAKIRMEILRKALDDQIPGHGRIGHNNPPGPDETQFLEEAREATTIIQAELQVDKPDVIRVARATRALRVAGDWLMKQANIAIESFSKAIGGAAAVGVAGYVVKNQDAMVTFLNDAVQSVVAWLSAVTLPF